MNNCRRSISIVLWCVVAAIARADNSDCLDCHEDESLTTERDGATVSVHVDKDLFEKSVHGSLECVDCHSDLNGVELPHDIPLKPVDCASCHDDMQEIFDASVHGLAMAKGDPLAPPVPELPRLPWHPTRGGSQLQRGAASDSFCLRFLPQRGYEGPATAEYS